MCDVCDREYRAERYIKRREHVVELSKACLKRKRERIATQGVSNGNRRCIECLEEKSPDNFRWANKSLDLKLPRCKKCDALHRADLYEEKKDQIITSNKRQYKKLRLILDSLKNGPCYDCGKTFPTEAMDFDHRDPSTKIDKVSAMVYKGSLPLLLAEIKKCDLVCAVCHRIRTKNRKLVEKKENEYREFGAS